MSDNNQDRGNRFQRSLCASRSPICFACGNLFKPLNSHRKTQIVTIPILRGDPDTDHQNRPQSQASSPSSPAPSWPRPPASLAWTTAMPPQASLLPLLPPTVHPPYRIQRDPWEPKASHFPTQNMPAISHLTQKSMQTSSDGLQGPTRLRP